MSPERSNGEWSRAVGQQAAVARLGQLGLRGDDIDVLLAQALQALGRTVGVPTVVLFEHRDGADELRGRCLLFEGVLIDEELTSRLRVPAARASMPGFTILHGAPVLSTDLHADGRFTARAAEYGLTARSAVTAPVGWGQRPWGVLAAYSEVVRRWSDDEVDFVQSVANTIGLAIARAGVEAELRDSSARLDLSLGAGGLGAWTWDLRSDDVVLSDSARAIFELNGDHGAFDGSADAFMDLVHPEDRLALRSDVYEALQTTGETHSTYRVRWRSGEMRWIESWGRLVHEDGRPARLVGVISDITDRRLADERRDRLLAAEQQARVAAEQARERLALLAAASERFNTTLDPEVVLGALPELCVPTLADTCVVDLLDGDDLVEEMARSVDDGVLDAMRALRARRPALGGTGAPWSSRQVARDGVSVFRADVTDDEYVAAATDDEHLALARRMGARSVLIVALVARRRVLGTLTLMINEGARRYDRDQLVLAEQLAARAALAIDNARLFESRNRVARSLQRSLLPPVLPTIDRLALAARYQVAEGDLAIGGDFYDVMELGHGAWGVVVGDVCGRGPDAAALTGLMRHSVRTAVVREHVPSRVLSQTNDAVLHQIDDARFCTAAYLRVEVPVEPEGAVRVRASSAGHPRPLVLRNDGSVELIECAGALLGVMEAPELVDTELELEPGDTVVLYTDGVTEARRGRELFGEDRLVATLARSSGSGADAVAAALEAAVAEFQDDANDDVAILVLQVRPGDPNPVGSAPGGAAPPTS